MHSLQIWTKYVATDYLSSSASIAFVLVSNLLQSIIFKVKHFALICFDLEANWKQVSIKINWHIIVSGLWCKVREHRGMIQALPWIHNIPYVPAILVWSDSTPVTSQTIAVLKLNLGKNRLPQGIQCSFGHGIKVRQFSKMNFISFIYDVRFS